jgi:hypothetical protein
VQYLSRLLESLCGAEDVNEVIFLTFATTPSYDVFTCMLPLLLRLQALQNENDLFKHNMQIYVLVCNDMERRR